MNISGICTSVQALLEGTNEFTTVLPHAPTSDDDFEGYPAAFHYYVDAESGYATVTQNRRVLEYQVEVYIKQVGTTPTQHYANAYALIDTIMQMFDESDDLNNACDILRPTPSVLERVTLTDGDGFRAYFSLYCEADITFRNS